MTEFTSSTLSITHAGVMRMLTAAVAQAEKMGQPQCIVVVDASGVTLGQIRMTGSKFLSLKSATAKACTAASIRAPSATIPEAVGPAIAAATNNAVTRLEGGLPIIINGACLGGIGIGSGSPDQDKAVAKAALNAIGAQADW